MTTLWQKILLALRKSEFWVAIATAFVAGVTQPVPEEVRFFAVGYIAVRVISAAVKFIFPNPESSKIEGGEWFARD